MHSPSVWGFLSIFSPSAPYCLSLSLSVSLASGHCRFNIGNLPVIRWQGCHYVRLASLPYYPGMCGSLQTPDKCQRSSVYNNWVQTLPQDTAAVFFSAMEQKGEWDRGTNFLVERKKKRRRTLEIIIIKKNPMRGKQKSQISQPHLVGAAVITFIREILPVGKIWSSHTCQQMTDAVRYHTLKTVSYFLLLHVK